MRVETSNRHSNKKLILAEMLLLMFTMVIFLGYASVIRAEEQNNTLAILIEEAMENNRDIISMEEKADALRAEAPYAGSLENPRLGLGLANVPVDSFRLDQEAMTQKQLFIAQKIPWFGTLDLAEQGAELKASGQDALVKAKRFEIIFDLKSTFYDLGFIDRSLETNDKLTKIVKQLLKVVETRYATGEGLQQDILSAQVQLSELVDEKIRLNSRRRLLNNKIGSLLNREDLADFSPPLDMAVPQIHLNNQVLTQIALLENPLVQSRKIDLDKALVGVELAKKKYMPDMDFRLSYGQRDDNPTTGEDRADFLSAFVTLSIPLWQATRQDSKLEATEKRVLAAQKSVQALERSIPHRLDALIAEIEGLKNNHNLFQNAVLVQSAQLAESSLAAYSVGKVQFDKMLSAHTSLIRYELQAGGYKYSLLKKLAELENLVGLSLASATTTYQEKTK